MLMALKKKLKCRIVQSGLRRLLPLSLVGAEYELPFRLQEIETRRLTKFDAICNFNFDDLCPMYDLTTGIDFGGRLNGGLLTQITAFLERFPETAMTFFVVPDYSFSRHRRPRNAPAQSCHIADEGNVEWLNHYKSLSTHYKVEFAVHGYHHRQDENPFFSRHTEFAFKKAHESQDTLVKAINCFTEVGLAPIGFRQPGWDLTSDLNIIPVLHDLGFQYICASSIDGGLNAGRNRVSNNDPTIVGPIVNLPQNIGLDEELPFIFEAITKAVEAKTMISIKGHFITSGMPNALGPNMWKLPRIATFMRESFASQIEHLTMAEVASRVPGKLARKTTK